MFDGQHARTLGRASAVGAYIRGERSTAARRFCGFLPGGEAALIGAGDRGRKDEDSRATQSKPPRPSGFFERECRCVRLVKAELASREEKHLGARPPFHVRPP